MNQGELPTVQKKQENISLDYFIINVNMYLLFHFASGQG